MRKKLNNLLKITLCLFMVLTMFGPVGVMADDDIVLMFNIAEELDFTLINGNTALGVNVGDSNQFMDFRDENDVRIESGITIDCPDDTV